MGYGSEFVLTLFANDPELARRADAAGIDRIGLDLESIGKRERQDPRKAWISDHDESQLEDVKRVLCKAKLFARTNTIHDGSKSEIERVLASGVEVLMLPMFKSAAEVQTFVDVISGRAVVSLLLETAEAVAALEDIVNIDGVDEIHIGLNDLHLSLGLPNHFELLVSPLMEQIADQVHAAGIPFGFGGVGRAEDPSLPISSQLLYPQYPLLGADRALVSRVFLLPDPLGIDIQQEIAAFRLNMDEWHSRPKEELLHARKLLLERARNWTAATA